TMSDCTLLDRCRIHTIEKYDYEPFTDHIATRDGWMFGVPLKGYKTYGYLYSQAFTDTRAAEEEMMSMLGAGQLEARGYDEHYTFRCYYANQLISGRVCKNGNKALFFEPLLANSMFLYIFANRLIFDYIVNGQDPSRCNTQFVKAIEEMEDVISYYYQGGTNQESEFWKAAPERAKARLEKRKVFSDYLGKLRQLKVNGLLHSGPPYAFSPHTWQIVDSQLGYGNLEIA
ncbi:MAG TPA: tryptophan 7-halogenase, partial [Polyangiaceae bacterium]